MSNLYRGPFKDASYQVSVHLVKRFQRRRFKKIGQSETSIACGGVKRGGSLSFLTIFTFAVPRVIGLDMTENRIFTLCRMIT
jgi:hypothetical protein